MSFAKHKALDELHEALASKVDMFVEAYIGRFKKQPLKSFVIESKVSTDASKLNKFLEAERKKIEDMLDIFAKQPELQNILEEMIAEINKTIYLCNLT